MYHTIVALVEDKPGVLNRVASLFRRRAFNIESLTVGHTDQPGVSRMTIVVDSDEVSVERLTAYLYRLVDVIQVQDLTAIPRVTRDLAMIKVIATPENRTHIMQTVDVPAHKKGVRYLRPGRYLLRALSPMGMRANRTPPHCA